MIKSMTAFARTADLGEWGNLVWELRSVNHRYLEIAVRLPEILRDFEMELREQVRNILKRGKIECNLKYYAGSQAVPTVVVNDHLVQQLSGAVKHVAQLVGSQTSPVEITQLLSWPGVLQVQEVDKELLKTKMFALFAQGLQDLDAVRLQEGKSIVNFMNERLILISQQLTRVKQRLPIVLAQQREKLLTKLAEISSNLDHARLEQEMVLFAQKIDVAEELDRLAGHIKEVSRVLQKEDVAGRRLDFLMQELNREANTLGAKSVDGEITLAAVELKVLIEQMREQVQNVE